MTIFNKGHDAAYRQWIESQTSGIEERTVHHKPRKSKGIFRKPMIAATIGAAICLAAEPGIHVADDLMHYLSREAQVQTQRGVDMFLDNNLPEASYQLNTKKFRVGKGVMSIKGLAELASKSLQIEQIIRETRTSVDLNKTYFETQMKFLNPNYTGNQGEEFTGIDPYMPFKKPYKK